MHFDELDDNLKKLYPTSPLEVGIPLEAVSKMVRSFATCNIPMHAVLMMRHGKIILENYYAPLEKNNLHRMFSICKSLNALAIGLLEQEGLLNLNDKIIKYFPDKVPDDVHPYIAAMTIRDMLMMRTCHASTTYKYNSDNDWVESFFTTKPTHQPGHVFRYDTSAAHVLCCLVERLSGENMLDYMKNRVLREIGWSEESYVLKNQFGELQGGSGLMCTPMDLLLLGQLLLQHGEWNGRQLLPRDFVDTATSNLTPTYATGPSTGELPGYGYQIWYGERENFVLYGMGGQFVICNPKYDLVLVTCADTQGLSDANRRIFDIFYNTILDAIDNVACGKIPLNNPHFNQFSYDTRTLAELSPHINALTELYPALPSDDTCQRDICYSMYHLEENLYDFDNFSITFDISNEYGAILYTLKGEPCRLIFGMEKCYPSIFPLYEQPCATSGCWISKNCFLIKSHLLGTCVGHVLWELSFINDHLQICMRKQEETMFQEYSGFLQGIQISKSIDK